MTFAIAAAVFGAMLLVASSVATLDREPASDTTDVAMIDRRSVWDVTTAARIDREPAPIATTGREPASDTTTVATIDGKPASQTTDVAMIDPGSATAASTIVVDRDAVAITSNGASVVRSLDGVVGMTPRDVDVTNVDAIGHATWVAAAARLSNARLSSDRRSVVAPTDVTFTVVGEDGVAIGELSTFVALEPGETQIVVAPRIEIASLPDGARVRIAIGAPSTSSAAPALDVVGVDIERATRHARITGRVVNTSSVATVANVNCAIENAAGDLVAVGVTTLRVAARDAALFRLEVHAAGGGFGEASCGAS